MITRLYALLPAILLLAGCGGGNQKSDGEFAARVGSEILSTAELDEALEVLPVGLDSVTARQQVIEQWVHSRLLAQEARRQGLTSQEDVQRQLADSERAVLAAALIDRFFEANAEEPTDEEIRSYFDANRQRLALREPYLQIRLLTTDSAERAQLGKVAMIQATSTPFADSLWAMTAEEFATDPGGAIALANRFLPESRLRGLDETVAQRGRSLAPGQISEVFESSGHHHVLEIVSRVSAGVTPDLPWIREELRQRLAIEKRNTMLAQQVQQLKNEAESDGRLEIR